MADEEKNADAERPVPILSRLSPPAGAVRDKRRRGRGPGSGLGKTGGKGQKGQLTRQGMFSKRGFEGGQMPLQRRVPKYGFNNPFSKKVATVNVRDLARFDAGATVDVAALRDRGLVRGVFDSVKVLGNGELDRKLKVQVHAYSKSAREKIEKAGGTAEVVE
jgi:large subunit ribosomal protein L15